VLFVFREQPHHINKAQSTKITKEEVLMISDRVDRVEAAMFPSRCYFERRAFKPTQFAAILFQSFAPTQDLETRELR
jgi:hypothetical protein